MGSERGHRRPLTALVGVLGAAIVIAFAATMVDAPAANATIPSVFGGDVSCAVLPAQGNKRRCRGVTKTWDGVTNIEAAVNFPRAPASGPDGPYPAIAIIPAWGTYIDNYELAPSPPTAPNARVRSYTDRGYAVFVINNRGWQESCGQFDADRIAPQCAQGYVHAMDTRYEVRDAQFLLSRLADENRINTGVGATGFSYGGSGTMALAALKDRVMKPDGTLMPWTSPGGLDMRVAVAAPEGHWTDFAQAFLPNGHSLDYVVDASYMKRGRIGVGKESYLDGLYAIGLAAANLAPPGQDPDADIHTWYARIMAGEPYDSDATVLDIADEVTTHHSSYYIDHSQAPAPLLAIEGFTDDVLPADEAIRYYNRTTTEYPGADISMFLFDAGHQRGQGKAADLAAMYMRQDAWFDYYLKGQGPKPFVGVEARTQTCPLSAASGGPYFAGSWAQIAPGEIREQSAAAQTIVPGAGDQSRSDTYDPIASTFTGLACATAAGSDQPGVATYRLDPAPSAGFTLMGSPTIIADINSIGPHSQIAARLLDVAPDGNATLVARGVYRPEVNSGMESTRQVFQLHPNGYKFAAGRVAKLELLPEDSPYVRRSNGQAPVTISNLELRLPVLENPDGGLVQAPAPKVLPPGYQLARDFQPADTTGPDTTIESRPSDPTSSTSATFTFSSSESGSTFECKLDSGDFESCFSSRMYSDLGEGQHTFQVRATDGAGNTDPTPATWVWTVDLTAPDTTIDSGPPDLTNSTSATFDFSSTQGGSTFECKLDSGDFESCSSPQTYPNLSEGQHTFEVRATDQAGNTDPTPDSRTWTIDTTAPDTTIDSGPSGTSNSTSATFEFTSSPSGATFECKLDSGDFESCSSPQIYSDLSEGQHTFAVRATDQAGNTDPTPDSRTWTIETTGTIIVNKDAVPDDPQDFDFSAGGGLSPTSFQLDDDADGTLSNTQTFTNVTPGSGYSISEANPGADGWYLGEASCDDASHVTNIAVSAGEVVTCTFTNARNYPRPGGATPLRVPLVPVFEQCTAPDSVHVEPIDEPSCTAPALESRELTMSTLGRGNGSLKLNVMPGDSETPEDEADVGLTLSASDVLSRGGGDYVGAVILRLGMRITDRANGDDGVASGTVEDTSFAVPVDCVATGGVIGSNCNLTTTLDAQVPGFAREGKRTVISALAVTLEDAGPDGDVVIPESQQCPPTCGTGDEATFLGQGVFAP